MAFDGEHRDTLRINYIMKNMTITFAQDLKQPLVSEADWNKVYGRVQFGIWRDNMGCSFERYTWAYLFVR